MRKLLFLSFILLALASCDDDPDDKYSDFVEGQNTKSTASKSGESVNGLYFSMDSVTKYVIAKSNEQIINEEAVRIIQQLVKKEMVPEYNNELGKKFGYNLTKEIKDSLAYYNYLDGDIGPIGKNGENSIILYGTSPYKEKGIWEEIIVLNKDIEKNHPALFQKACANFFKNQNPQMSGIVIENQGGNFIEYNANITYSSGNEHYVHFRVANKNEKLAITIGASVEENTN
jgi:hypothetical protein